MALWGPYSRASTDTKNEKPLPSLPSPTLTNPDLVLPNEPFTHTLASPAHASRATPRISYLRTAEEHTNSINRRSLDVEERALTGYHGPTERRGLLSRKMLLVRSDTGGGNVPDIDVSRTVTAAESSSLLPSSPLLKDHLTVAPTSSRRASSSSLDSDEMARMPEFLSKYKNTEADDEVTDTESSAVERAYNAERKAKEEEEHVSAMLSQRAEEILANAKKRLNLMEGNLRGARDLVAPLTAANLKRATSLSHSFGSQSMSFTHRRLDSLAYDSDPYNPSRRMLQSQASSPAMRSDFFGHARGGSEIELADRPYTAFSSRSPHVPRSPRFPVKPSEPQAVLRTVRSHDAIGLSKLNIPESQTREQPSKDSPSSNLEPVSEDDDHYVKTSSHNLRAPDTRSLVGLGVSTAPRSISGSSAGTSEDIRDQMESLKGRISSLKERAKEDRLRRASNNDLRNASPFNNASHTAPEFWYTQPSNYGISQIDTNADTTEPERIREDSPTTPHAGHVPWRTSGPTSSRNAFAEKAARDQAVAPQSSASGGSSPVDKYNARYSAGQMGTKRGSGGTAILTSSHPASEAHRSREMPGAFESGQFDSSDEYESDPRSEETSIEPNSEPSTPEPNGTYSSDDDSFGEEYDELEHDETRGYDQASEAVEADFIAHEDREDAFDYEHFFLHSAMGSYNSGRDSPSDSDMSSVSSAGTARAPNAAHEDPSDFDGEIDELDAEQEDELDEEEEEEDQVADISRTPGTPDALRQIEARLQHARDRSISTESLDTINTFATATEGRDTPAMISRSASRADWPTTPTETVRPGTAVRTDVDPLGPIMAKPFALAALERDDASDRADSGVGGLARSQGQSTPRSTPGPGSDSLPRSTPSSPARTVVQQQQQYYHAHSLGAQLQSQDPTTLAFKTLLEPDGKPLGLKDKAVIFGLIESLRTVCVRLQKEDESKAIGQASNATQQQDGLESMNDSQFEMQDLRRRLEKARRVLDGLDTQ